MKLLMHKGEAESRGKDEFVARDIYAPGETTIVFLVDHCAGAY